MRILKASVLVIVMVAVSAPISAGVDKAQQRSGVSGVQQRGSVQTAQRENERIVIRNLEASLASGLNSDSSVLLAQWQQDPESLGQAGTHALIEAMVLQLGQQQQLTSLDIAGVQGIARIQASGADPDDVKRLQIAWIEARAAGTEPSPELAELFMTVSAQNAALSHVRFKTFRDGAEVKGVMVKYEALKSRDEELGRVVAAGASEVLRDMPMSWYFVWTEQNGRPTSDKNARFDVLSEDVEIRLVIEPQPADLPEGSERR